MKETPEWVRIPKSNVVHPEHRLRLGLVIVACIIALAILMIAGWVVSMAV